MSELERLFAAHYRGRHDPGDALWWIDHPEQPGPTGREPVQRDALAAVDALHAAGRSEAAAALLEALAELIAADREVALRALEAARAGLKGAHPSG